jgi:hypothetical protein
LDAPPAFPLTKRRPYFRPLEEFECATCGFVIVVPGPEKEPEIIDGICIDYGVNFEQWLREQGWVRHDMGVDYYVTDEKGRRRKTGLRWTEYECKSCATSLVAR